MAEPDVSVLVGEDEVEALAPEWSAAAEASGSALYATPEWVLSLWTSHQSRRGTRFVCVRSSGALRAVFPLFRQDVRKGGLAFSQVGLLTNHYGQNHNEMVVFDEAEACLDRLLRSEVGGGWDIFFASSVPEGGPTHRLLERAARTLGHRLVVEPYVASPYLTLAGGWDGFLKSRSANFRSDMKRKWSRAERAGMEFRVHRGEAELAEALPLIWDLETRSWKEGAGTSITVQTVATRFYETFLPLAARRGWLYIVLLSLGGRPAAYDMGILHGGKYYMLKTSFDQALGDLSPGVVLRQWVVRELFTMGVGEHDFLGDADPYKLRWTEDLRKHVNLYLYSRRSWKALAWSWLRSFKR